MIKAVNLTKTFGQSEAATCALKEVSLEINTGEMISIMGPSGCGKTTLLHMLSGIDHADSGEIWVENLRIDKLKERKLSEFRLNNMGFIFQAYHLIPVLSVVENVELPLIARGVHHQTARDRSLQALEEVGLLEKARRLPSELSGGQNQRVAIARAIVGTPKVIWADEPTGALDTQTADQVMGLLRMLNTKHGTTLVIVTHDPNVAAQTQRTIYMENGRILPKAEVRHA